jgi:hypothetical protein
MTAGLRPCDRHGRRLRLALELRGLGDQPSAIVQAENAIATHATNFAGAAAADMLATTDSGQGWCPLCFVNLKNPAGQNLDDWIDYAADEVLADSRRVTRTAPLVALHEE